jgi:hypothetical protein
MHLAIIISFFSLRRSNDDAKWGRCILTTFRTCQPENSPLSSLCACLLTTVVASCCYMEIFQSTASTLEGRKHWALAESSALASCPPPEPRDVPRRLLVCHRAPGLTRGPFRQDRGPRARAGFTEPSDSSRARRSEPVISAPRWVQCTAGRMRPVREEMGRR